MAASNNARTNAFAHPGPHHVVSDLSFHAQQIAGADAEFGRMVSMNPERICVRYFVEPLRISASSMNLHRQTEGRNQNRFIFGEIGGMDMTRNVVRNRELRPAPVDEGARIEFQPAARSREASLDFFPGPNSY